MGQVGQRGGGREGKTISVGQLCVRVQGFLWEGGPGGMMEAVRMIRSGSYNICNGCNVRLKSAMQGMSQWSMYLGVFQDMKVSKGVYTR